ncbi:MAG: hypothetical protein IK061_02845, partial [Desulfovibrio sp.]|nr:hypothetical protein [Desulfovibrio sp.]
PSAERRDSPPPSDAEVSVNPLPAVALACSAMDGAKPGDGAMPAHPAYSQTKLSHSVFSLKE